MNSSAPDSTQQVQEHAIQVHAKNVFGALEKLLRATLLYEGRGRLVEQGLNDLTEQVGVALSTGPLTVQVAPIGLMYEGVLISDESKPPRYLFRLFCDGFRELTLLPGLPREELQSLVTVLQTDPKDMGDDDLVTLLWKQELKFIRYYAVDTIGMGMKVDADGDLTLAADAESSMQLHSEESGEMLVLSASDLRMLRSQDAMPWVKDCHAPTEATGRVAELAGHFREAFQRPLDTQRFVQLALRFSADEPEPPSPLVLGMLDALLFTQDVEQVAELLSCLQAATQAGTAAQQTLRRAVCVAERMRAIAVLYGPHYELLTPSLSALSDGAELVELLKQLDPGSAQDRLQEVLEKKGVDLTPYYLQHLEDPNTPIVINAIKALGRIGSPQSVKALSAALNNSLAVVRQASLKAMKGRYDQDSRVYLGRMLKDPDRENRLLALQLLADSGDRRVGWLLMSAVQSSSFNDRDAEEQATLFSTLASFKDTRTLAYLETVLTDRNLSRNAGILNRQMMATQAIAAMKTPEAVEVLERCSHRWFLPASIKKAIQAALSKLKRS